MWNELRLRRHLAVTRASRHRVPPRARLLSPTMTALIFICAFMSNAAAQTGSHILYGDFKVEEGKAEGQVPLSFDVVLYDENGTMIGRQTVTNGGRYRFMNLGNGWYSLVVEVEANEVARMRVQVASPFKNDFRQDISMEWRARPLGRDKAGAVSAADFYKRTSASQSLFEKAEDALNKKRYEEATALLRQIVGSDGKDYQAWTELGTARLLQNDAGEAEKDYLRAAEVNPSFPLALLNLGRLRLARKDYEGAIEFLTGAVELKPPSADANYLLGESYLQLKKGSKAVGYLEEAARLGRNDAHLRLAALYHGAGLKDRAAAEYEQFLAAEPTYADRKKLEQYIKENKKK
ncbi:MAG: tetratricopeptide repeat protein [Pyrinomonadaceae bacterium]